VHKDRSWGSPSGDGGAATLITPFCPIKAGRRTAALRLQGGSARGRSAALRRVEL